MAAALRLFCARGFAAVSTQDICDTAGVQKGSLYHFFKAKIDVAIAALERYGDSVANVFRAAAEGRDLPERKLLKIFEGAQAMGECHQAEAGVMYGCLHGNLSLELAAADERVRACLVGITRRWIMTLNPIMEELMAARVIPLGDPHTAGHTVLAYLHGVVLMAKAANEPALILRMGQQAIGLLGGRVGPSR
ncbi:TetR/AcrR family transcriptional regulator [Frigoriglobus tundricola]|uniref:TetR/AcrR family transcriptional regulator n=1 Tax=Frigoriglobus tundricola TaxID=2774151 RepID=UPI00148EDA77|nr:TetR/AcrR family transcriptional regulator [Frigoriglobus tundricola]